MDLKSYSKTLTDIYLVSNTPSYLYQTMRKSNIVTEYLSKYSKEDLFKEFSERIDRPVSDVSEIAELYAILISLTFKNNDSDVQGFFKSVTNIKFEWFSKIANYYLSGADITNEQITVVQYSNTDLQNSNYDDITVHA